MAMVECRECGGQVSQKADTCPCCGDVMPNEPLLKGGVVFTVVWHDSLQSFRFAGQPRQEPSQFQRVRKKANT